MIDAYLESMPIVAILRGVTPDTVVAIARVLYGRGIRCIEVPLNSPQARVSIERLAEAMPGDCLVGAGTVLSANDVIAVRDAGGRLVVTPNVCEEVLRTALRHDLAVLPGFASPTEAFAAIRLGATRLKLFPANSYGPAHLRALLAVLPTSIRVLAVGGVAPTDFPRWRDAGVWGFGVGSELYRAGDRPDDVAGKLETLLQAL